MNHYFREPDKLVGGPAVSALEQLAAWWAHW